MKIFKTILLLSIFYINLALASDELVSKDQFQSLSDTVKALESRIQKLEGGGSGQKVKSSIGSSKKANWRKLKRGMTLNEVTELLGEPGDISVYSSGGQTWWYPNALGGKVSITDDKVDGWSEPSR